MKPDSFLSRPQKESEVSLSVVVFDTPAETVQACIDSIIRAVRNLNHAYPHLPPPKLWIVDNSEENSVRSDSFRAVANMHDDGPLHISILGGHGNIGYGRGHNLAFLKSTSAFHIFMNADITVDPDSLLEGYKFLISNTDVVAVSPLCIDQKGRQQYLCKRLPTIFDLFLRGFAPEILKNFYNSRLAYYEAQDIQKTELTIGVPIISGCFMVCRCDALNKVASFDPNYFLYFEDFDLSIRLSSEGNLAYLPSMKITHEGGYAAKKGFLHIWRFCRSAIRFFNTYGWRLI